MLGTGVAVYPAIQAQRFNTGQCARGPRYASTSTEYNTFRAGVGIFVFRAVKHRRIRSEK